MMDDTLENNFSTDKDFSAESSAPAAAEHPAGDPAQSGGVPPMTEEARWYVVHTYSGYENKEIGRASCRERV